MHARPWITIATAAAALLIAAPLRAEPDDTGGPPTDKQLLALAARADASTGWHWSEPTVIRFNDTLGAEGWTFTNAKVQRKKDHWVITAKDRFYVHRALPRGFDTAPAVRIDAWLRAFRPDDNPIRIGLGTVDARGHHNALHHFLFDFAMNRDGETQQVIMGRDYVRELRPMPWGKPVHVSILVSGLNVVGRRDHCDPIAAVGVRQAKLDKDTHIALQGWMKRVEWLALSFRKLQRGEPEEPADRQALAARRKLKALLLNRVIPQLGDRAFQRRQETTRLLRTLGAAAQPAINQALADDNVRTPEVRIRLSQLSYKSTEKVNLRSLPTPALDEAPTTRPDDGGGPNKP